MAAAAAAAATKAMSITTFEASRAVSVAAASQPSPVATLVRVLCFCKETGKLYIALPKYGNMLSGTNAVNKYTFPVGFLALDENVCGYSTFNGKSYGGCAERSAYRTLVLDLYKLASTTGVTYYHDDLSSKSPLRCSRQINPSSDSQLLALSFTTIFGVDKLASMPVLGARNAEGGAIPYGDQSMLGFEFACADWVLADDIISGKAAFSFNQLNQALVLLGIELPEISKVEAVSLNYPAALVTEISRLAALANAVKKN